MGSRIRELRQKRELRQVDLAARTGIGLTTVRLIESGGVLTERSAKLIADALGVKVETLTGGVK